MNPEEHQKWLTGLKAGDQVAIDQGTGIYYGRRYSIEKLAKVTGTKRRSYVTENDDVYDTFGERRVGGTWGRTVKLMPWTQEIADEIERYQLVQWLKTVQWEKRPLAKLRAVQDLLTEE